MTWLIASHILHIYIPQRAWITVGNKEKNEGGDLRRAWKEEMSIAMIIKIIDTLKGLTLCKLDKDEREGSGGDQN